MLNTPNSIIETASNPTIQYGGKSSSEVLNLMNDNLRSDILTLITKQEDLEDLLAKATGVYAMQSAAIAAQTANLSSTYTILASSLGASARATVVDFYTNVCVEAPTDGSTAATINTTYGQATLSVNNTQDKLITEDTNGDVWIPESLKIRYCYKASGTTPPQDYEYTEITDPTYAVDLYPDTAWVEHAAGVTDVWVKVTLPTEVFSNDQINTVCLHPYPVFKHNLKGIYHRTIGGSWGEIDLSYLPGYVTDRVYSVGNVRVIFPRSQAAELLIHLEITDGDNTYWGFSMIRAQLLEFASTSKLNVTFTPLVPSATYLSPQYVVRGKDETALAQMSKTITDKNVEYALTQYVAGSSPVITSIESTWTI